VTLPALHKQLACVLLRSALPIVDCDISFLRWTVIPTFPRPQVVVVPEYGSRIREALTEAREEGLTVL
jgi:hypothetical protein